MAGLGAPEVSQCRMTDMPSITVLSEGPAVMFGAIPAGRRRHGADVKPAAAGGGEEEEGGKEAREGAPGAPSASKRRFVRGSLLQLCARLMFAAANSSRDTAFTSVSHRLLTGYFLHPQREKEREREIAEPERRREEGGTGKRQINKRPHLRDAINQSF